MSPWPSSYSDPRTCLACLLVFLVLVRASDVECEPMVDRFVLDTTDIDEPDTKAMQAKLPRVAHIPSDTCTHTCFVCGTFVCGSFESSAKTRAGECCILSCSLFLPSCFSTSLAPDDFTAVGVGPRLPSRSRCWRRPQSSSAFLRTLDASPATLHLKGWSAGPQRASEDSVESTK
jgi:hypothetical protein